MKDELISIVHENPESTILIKQVGDKPTVRIDVDEYENFEIQTGPSFSSVGISSEERERKKRRKDLKMKLKNAGMSTVQNVYTISRINDEPEKDSDIKDVQKQQRNRRSPGN